MIGRRSRELAGRMVTLSVLILIGILWARLLMVQPRADSETARPLPSTVQSQMAKRKVDEISGATSRLAEAARRGVTRSTVLTLSAGEINAILSEQPEVRGVLEEARVPSPEVSLQPGRIITTATVQAAGALVRVTAEGQLTARGGMLIYASDRVRVAGLPAPGPIRAAVESRIQEAFRRVEQQAQARVDQVTIGQNRITLRLSSRTD